MKARRRAFKFDFAERAAFLAGCGFGVYLGLTTVRSEVGFPVGLLYAPFFGIACVAILYLIQMAWSRRNRLLGQVVRRR